MSRPLVGVVLAAGQGTRMRSEVPKVAHAVCGRPLVSWVVRAVASLAPSEIIVVVGHGADSVQALVDADSAAGAPGIPVRCVEQPEQRGTGDAVVCAMAALEPGQRDVLVVAGDMPLLTGGSLGAMVASHTGDETAVTVLTSHFSDPTGYGRVVRDMGGSVARIVEHRDCSPDQLDIDEVAVSTYVFEETRLREALAKLQPENAQGELYLTDAVEMLFPDVDAVAVAPDDVRGINDRAQLAAAAALMRVRINTFWMREGVSMVDPERTYIDADVVLTADVTLLPGCVLEGRTSVGGRSVVGPNTRLVDTAVGADATLSYCVARESQIDDGAEVGPYASLRPGTHLRARSKLGTFCETKNADIGEGAKVPHLSYMGDVEIGAGSNIGANTITCNYDGQDKHRTIVGRGVKTGSGTLLVAPVELGDDAYTGAGAVVTKDVPARGLAKGVPASVTEEWTTQNREVPPR